MYILYSLPTNLWNHIETIYFLAPCIVIDMLMSITLELTNGNVKT